MTNIRFHSLVLIALFLSLSCITVVQAVGGVERYDAPCSGGSGEVAFYMFDRSDESDPSAHIVINEIEQNPAGFDEGHEWVELYNPTTSDVNLDGWKLSPMHGKTVTVTLRETIPAKGYFVYTHAEQWLDNDDESVTLRDPHLDGVVGARPDSLDAIYQSNVAADFVREREVVIRKLQRLGVHCLDVAPHQVTTDLLSRYLEIKRRELF